jgi:hypothetical protein
VLQLYISEDLLSPRTVNWGPRDLNVPNLDGAPKT